MNTQKERLLNEENARLKKLLSAQNKTLEIEAALERVRSRSMCMQKSEELKEIIKVVYEQLVHLNILVEHAGFLMDYKERDDMHIWLADQHLAPSEITIPWFDSPPNNSIKEAKEKGQDFFKYLLTFEEKNKFYRDLFRFVPDVPEETLKYYLNCPGLAGSGVLLENIGLYIENFDGISYTDEENATLMRFGKVFEQTYTRFLDLQKAEAQAKESQIQLALERVRARTMAMQKSEELSETVFILFQQFKQLGENPDQATIGVINEDEKVIEYWVTMYGNPINKVFKFSLDEPNVTNKIYKAWKENKKSLVIDLSGNALVEFMKYRADKGGAAINSEEKRRIINVAFFSKGLLNVQSNEERSEESIKLLERFASVFEQTYTRFLDLQKAEAQAREAQIQLALERVRARTMAMQKQNDLLLVLDLLVEQLVKLGVNLQVANFSNGLPGGDWNLWIEVVADANTIFNNYVHFPRIDHPYFHHVEKNIETFRKDGTDLFKDVFSKEEKDSWQDYINTQTIYKDLTSEEILQSMYKKPGYTWSMVILKDTWVSICRYDTIPFSVEDDALLRRFANAFGQTYTRFLDLQKAEAQAREAQIEAALERVRSRTMAMQNSDELADLVATVFKELNRLEFALTSCIIWINNPEFLTAEMWVASTEMNKPPEPYYIKPFRHPYFKSIIDAWKQKNKKWVYEMNGEEKKIFQQLFFDEVGSFPTLMKNALEAPESVIYSASFYNFGALEIIGTEHVTDEKFEILHRLGKVFDMSYTRFNDLKQAEAQAREATIEAALERVRSRTMAMQKSDELAETSAILFRQLIHLGIAPNRLYIGVINDKNTHIEFWITDEDGLKVRTMFSGDAAKNNSIKKMYDGWKQQKKSIVIDMQGKELDEYFHYPGNELRIPFQGGLTQKRRIQYISYFSKGFIGMVSPDEQPEKIVLLLDRFAAVFNLTFTRFNDLKVAEVHAIQAEQDLIEIKASRKKAEDALSELQATQKQLIQSEKMASLGELTAGIAHEIQNPLNFVNNFSDVNRELIGELVEEVNKKNYDEVKLIAADIKENEQKINHHGKRADAIVKGMLQHSRTSTGQKEPTNINALCDEYLRLSYHGLRAKDKLFNATMKTDFDENIGKINIIPQDMGRVLLNIFNNAFYAVNARLNESFGQEQKNRNLNSYQPIVSVTTKKSDKHVIITFSDNGNGIPQNIVDKIFQPFFTTKPTGEGTGLGLSLAYDIIKAHGGELKVESKEGEFTKFVLLLPL